MLSVFFTATAFTNKEGIILSGFLITEASCFLLVAESVITVYLASLPVTSAVCDS